MHKTLFRQKNFFRFYVVFVWNATIDWTHCSALRLVMETFALCALVGNDVIVLVTDRFLRFVGIDPFSVDQD